jgi:hypothetical protein
MGVDNAGAAAVLYDGHDGWQRLQTARFPRCNHRLLQVCGAAVANAHRALHGLVGSDPDERFILERGRTGGCLAARNCHCAEPRSRRCLLPARQSLRMAGSEGRPRTDAGLRFCYRSRAAISHDRLFPSLLSAPSSHLAPPSPPVPPGWECAGLHPIWPSGAGGCEKLRGSGGA